MNQKKQKQYSKQVKKYRKHQKKVDFKLTLKNEDDTIFKVLPIILVALEDNILMSYEKVTQRQSRLIIGTKQTLKAMKNGDVSEVFIADDADQFITQKVADLANQIGIPCKHVDSMEKLGTACGIDVATSTAAIKR
ncbi:ribosomal L7Ae/L30e/S12e/Gadd45 family protein [Virgibacillus byunsanensis]|uniref:ribosomal L7Ae/L30e/S12e/Gadd45 family protein n=1 Tax=Virgibacillus byunsanensis TaxID=570945 RepID=UPI0036F43191